MPVFPFRTNAGEMLVVNPNMLLKILERIVWPLIQGIESSGMDVVLSNMVGQQSRRRYRMVW